MNQVKKSIQESLKDAANIKTEIIILILTIILSVACVALSPIILLPTLFLEEVVLAIVTIAGSVSLLLVYFYIIYYILRKNTKKTGTKMDWYGLRNWVHIKQKGIILYNTIKKTKFTKFALTFMAVTLLALVPVILLATHTLDTLETFIYETPGETLKEYTMSLIITETLNPFTLISILLWFLLFYSPFILLIENTGIIDSIKKSIRITTKQPELIALSIITANILFVLPLFIASIPFILILSPVIIIPCTSCTFVAPISLILIIPAIIISTIISFSFISHYYENALQKI